MNSKQGSLTSGGVLFKTLWLKARTLTHQPKQRENQLSNKQHIAIQGGVLNKKSLAEGEDANPPPEIKREHDEQQAR